MVKLLDSSDEEAEKEQKEEGEEDKKIKSRKKERDILKINKKFAQSYEYRQQMKELQEYKKSENILSDEDYDSSSSEEEDEDAELLTSNMDIKILETIKKIREKDDTIYKSDVRFFDDDEEEEEEEEYDEAKENKKIKKNNDSMKIKDVLKRQILDQMDKDEVSESEFNDEEDLETRKKSKLLEAQDSKKLCYDKEQEEIRKSFLNEAFSTRDDNDDEDELFQAKDSTSKKLNSDEHDKREKELLNEILINKKKLSFSDPRGEIENGESFLLDYISNKRWIDRNYEFDTKNIDDNNEKNDEGDDEDSLNELEQSEQFESKYNFRFEEGTNNGQLMTYARSNNDTLRQTTQPRKEKDLDRKLQKQQRRKEKEELLKRLKNAKKVELQKRLEQIKLALGNDVVNKISDEIWDEILCDEDWNEEKLEKIMKRVFDDDYYNAADATEENAVLEDKKDILQGMEFILGEEYDEQGYYNEDENGDDDDYEENNEQEKILENEEYDEEQHQDQNLHDKLQSKIQDQIYKLDYEDIIDDSIKCRFKYKSVPANNYGLSTEEILVSKDSTLKQLVSIKQMVPYQENEVEVERKKRKKFKELWKEDYKDFVTKKNILEQTNSDVLTSKIKKTSMDEIRDNINITKKRKRSKKKGRKKTKVGANADEDPEQNKSNTTPNNSQSENNAHNNKEDKNKNREKKRKRSKKKLSSTVAESRLASYGL